MTFDQRTQRHILSAWNERWQELTAIQALDINKRFFPPPPPLEIPSFSTLGTPVLAAEIYSKSKKQPGFPHGKIMHYLDEVHLNLQENYAFARWHLHPWQLKAHFETAMNGFYMDAAAQALGVLVSQRDGKPLGAYKHVVIKLGGDFRKVLTSEDPNWWLAVIGPRHSVPNVNGMVFAAFGTGDSVRTSGFAVCRSRHLETNEPLLF